MTVSTIFLYCPCVKVEDLSFFCPAINVKELEAVVISPSGTSDKCEIADIGNSEYSIKFVPKEIGVHTVSVKHKGIHIPGSPFQFTVGPITEGGAHKVRAHGPGLERGEILVPCKSFAAKIGEVASHGLLRTQNYRKKGINAIHQNKLLCKINLYK